MNDSPGKPLILVIDDDPEVRSLMVEALRRNDFEVVLASDGGEGMRAIRRQKVKGRPVDLVVTDMVMPGKDGTETIVDLRRWHPEVPILAVSGGGRDYLNAAAVIGADRVLEKPFAIDDFLASVRACLEVQAEP